MRCTKGIVATRKSSNTPPTIDATHTSSDMVNCRALTVRNNSGTIHLAVSSAPTTDKVSFWNVTNPASISSVVAAQTVTGCNELYLTNALTMFVACNVSGNDGIRRISNWSTTPSVSALGSSADAETIGGFARNGTFNRLYGAASLGNVVAFTTAAPPAYTATLTDAKLGGASDMAEVDVSGTIYLVCVAESADYLTVIETSSIDAPTIAGSVTDADLNGCTRVVSIGSSSVAVLSPTANTVTIVDISTPASPSIVGTLTNATYLPSTVTDIGFDGTYLMVTDPVNDRVVTVDISTPSSPTIRGFLADGVNLDGVSRVVGLSGKFYVLTPGTDGFAVLSV